jgi:alkylation response protein AidB-like acyl-CoA dehydrogenase
MSAVLTRGLEPSTEGVYPVAGHPVAGQPVSMGMPVGMRPSLDDLVDSARLRLTSSRGQSLLAELSRLRPSTERTDAWPVEAWGRMVDSGLLAWGIPAEHGGHACTTRELLEAYIDVGRSCLTTAFILTQRNSAVQRIIDSNQTELKERLLPPIASGQLLVTLGISHLTTSRQHMVRPVVEAKSEGSSLVLDGEIPWVTAAPQADLIVAGGAFRDGRQVLVLVPTDARGVHVRPPSEMMALNASQTAVVALDGVEVPARYILAGPIENVIRKSGSAGGAGSLSTSALAIGQTRYALARMAAEAESRRELADFVVSLTDECDRLERALLVSATPPAFPIDAASLRTEANSLVTRTTQAWFALAKGAGYLDEHPAAIAVRQALFFLVWSCPQPVLTAALRELTRSN